MAKMNDKEQILEAYNDVRNDETATNWCCLKYDESNTLSLDSMGEEFDELKAKFGEDERVYAFLRVQTGDEMSKRMKFALIMWVGPRVSAMKKAKMSTEKAFVKQVFLNFAVEMLFDDLHDVKYEKIREEMIRAGGANYGTGRS
ncbi:COTL1-like protein [Mya arenaria]|uniref:COTL1-like protein n=1 Tax=Mya arenaria TaxID=6604 RepID=A0ABY7ER43_MYAAR|nr:coactosin-like protein [Mya arenaria]WAR12423.1 COTL1-like protein [Mya arenaria]